MPQAVHPPPSQPRARGFSLVELMIALAVLSILATIALPAYFDSIRKGRRAEAFTALSAVQQAQERWRGNFPSYASNLTAAPTASPPGLGLPATSAPNGYYAISLESVSATGYTVTAAATSSSSQYKDGNCARLRIVVAGGNVTQSAAANAGAFDTSNAARCWPR